MHLLAKRKLFLATDSNRFVSRSRIRIIKFANRFRLVLPFVKARL